MLSAFEISAVAAILRRWLHINIIFGQSETCLYYEITLLHHIIAIFTARNLSNTCNYLHFIPITYIDNNTDNVFFYNLTNFMWV